MRAHLARSLAFCIYQADTIAAVIRKGRYFLYIIICDTSLGDNTNDFGTLLSIKKKITLYRLIY